MEKLIRGILDFRKNLLPQRRETFARLAVGQAPDVLFVTCSDSRVAPNWFASTNPGDLFVIRNVGNIVPPCELSSGLPADTSVAAAIDFSLNNLKVTDIVVCGHSGCGAIHALATGIHRLPETSASLRHWLQPAENSLGKPSAELRPATGLTTEDQLSQQNVLRQIDNLKTYPAIQARLKNKSLRLHAWWFNIALGGVYAYNSEARQFILIDDQVGEALLADQSHP